MSLQRLIEVPPPDPSALMRIRANTLVEVSERIQATNRRVLTRLRPMAIGQAALADVIAGLIADFERNDSDHEFKLLVGNVKSSYGETIDLTVYRCVQEGVTNAVRHAQARAVLVRLEEPTIFHAPSDGGSVSPELRLCIMDDGHGLLPGATPGLGLASMEQRVRALGGAFSVSNRTGGGTCLAITIPVGDAAMSVSEGRRSRQK